MWCLLLTFPDSFSWWWLISSVFLTKTSCHKTTHATGYYGAWPRWAISVSALLLTLLLLTILHCHWTTKSVIIQNSRIKINRDAKKYCDKSGCDRNKIYYFKASYYVSSTLNVLHISAFFLVQKYLHFIFFFVRFFLMWTLLKVCIEFVTILLPFYVLVFWP